MMSNRDIIAIATLIWSVVFPLLTSFKNVWKSRKINLKKWSRTPKFWKKIHEILNVNRELTVNLTNVSQENKDLNYHFLVFLENQNKVCLNLFTHEQNDRIFELMNRGTSFLSTEVLDLLKNREKSDHWLINLLSTLQTTQILAKTQQKAVEISIIIDLEIGTFKS